MGHGVADSETRRADWGVGYERRFRGNVEPSHLFVVTGYGRRFRGNVGNVEGRGAVWLVREAAREYGHGAVDSGLASEAAHAAHAEYTDACDCGPRAGRGHTLTALGPALDVGRSRRTIPPALRRALEFRDKGCRFPDHSPAASGARGTRFAEGHHIIHWEDGGPTSLDNLALLCRDHHRCVHEEGFTVRMDERGEPAFATPSGFPLPSVPRYDVRGRLEVLLAANRQRGVAPDFRTGRTEWPRLDDVPLDVRERVW
jgi:hypothetical protein